MRVQPGSPNTRRAAHVRATRVPERRMLLARVGWGILVALTLVICFASLPEFLAQVQTPCTPTACQYQQLTPAQVETLQGIGWSVGAYTAFTLTLLLITIGVCLLVSTLLIWRRPDERMALLVALLLVTFGPTDVIVNAPATSAWLVPDQAVTFLMASLFVLVFSVFPSGRFVPRWLRWNLVGWLALLVLLHFFRPVSFRLPTSLVQPGWLLFLCELALVACVQIYRYRRVSSPLERQQTKWVVFGLAWPALVGVPVSGLVLLFPATVEHQALVLLAYNESGFVLNLALPLAFGVAILRYRLWEIDLLINRTLVYGTLTLSVIGLYVLFVVGLGSLVQAQGNLLLSLLATGVIAVLFQPLRARLQQGVNHLLYGERDDPARVLTRLGHRLEATLTPEAVLPAIVETVAQALKLPAAAITWTTAEGDAEPHIGAIYGELHAQTDQTAVPLVYQQETVGALVLALRTPGEDLTPADHRFLRHLAPQIGVAVHAVRLTADLKHLTADLQRSRTELVTAREEERRRLRRDLHDGLGSVLTALNWRAGALRPLLHRDPVTAEALLVEQQHTIQAAIADIRRLVYDLRPPALDELGLLGALREQAAKLRTDPARDQAAGLLVEVEAPETLPALPAAVEVAAYRIVQEALTNIARHAQAHHASLRLACTAERLEIDLLDDGVGLPAAHPVGVGLLSMRERAAEVGGSCEVQRVAAGGTRVHAVLPLPRDED